MPDVLATLIAVERSLARVTALAGNLRGDVDSVVAAVEEARRQAAAARSAPTVYPVGSLSFMVERLRVGLDDLGALMPAEGEAREQLDQCRVMCATVTMMAGGDQGRGPGASNREGPQ